MINWWIVVGLVILVFVFLRVRHMKHKMYAVLLILLILFFYITAVKVVNQTNLNISSFGGFIEASKVYFSWLGGVVSNLGDLVGHAIKLDWKGNMTDSLNGA